VKGKENQPPLAGPSTSTPKLILRIPARPAQPLQPPTDDWEPPTVAEAFKLKRPLEDKELGVGTPSKRVR
jgi:hypothetical protein